MEELEWKDEYLLGNQLIDKEHQIFAGLVNKLIRAVDGGMEDNYLDRIIMEIQKYAEFHFVSEENYMIDLDYPELAEHQNQHIMLMEKFTLALSYLELGKKSYHDFTEFLIDWFKNHTLTQDMSIVNFVNQSQGGE